jgi:hypothetical protein
MSQSRAAYPCFHATARGLILPTRLPLSPAGCRQLLPQCNAINVGAAPPNHLQKLENYKMNNTTALQKHRQIPAHLTTAKEPSVPLSTGRAPSLQKSITQQKQTAAHLITSKGSCAPLSTGRAPSFSAIASRSGSESTAIIV